MTSKMTVISKTCFLEYISQIKLGVLLEYYMYVNKDKISHDSKVLKVNQKSPVCRSFTTSVISCVRREWFQFRQTSVPKTRSNLNRLNRDKDQIGKPSHLKEVTYSVIIIFRCITLTEYMTST